MLKPYFCKILRSVYVRIYALYYTESTKKYDVLLSGLVNTNSQCRQFLGKNNLSLELLSGTLRLVRKSCYTLAYNKLICVAYTKSQ